MFTRFLQDLARAGLPCEIRFTNFHPDLAKKVEEYLHLETNIIIRAIQHRSSYRGYQVSAVNIKGFLAEFKKNFFGTSTHVAVSER